MADHLFAGRELQADLRSNLTAALEALETWDPDAFLSQSDADLITAVLDVGTVECPELHRVECYLDGAPEEVVREVHNAFRERVKVRLTRYTMRIPFTGHPAPFSLKASTYFSSPIPGAVDEKTSEIVIAWEGQNPDPAAVKRSLDQQLDTVEKGLAFARNDINAHNGNLINQVPGRVAARRTRLLKARQVHAEIGFPIRRRPDADAHTFPLRRRRLVAQPAPGRNRTATPFEPEPTLLQADYEAALAVLRNARNAFERSPTLAEKLGEERIRDVLLILLNAHFEGKAGGEVFNNAGKTDILIRDNDTNIFIAECKIFGPKDGPGKITATIDQLLSYLTWRDTKSALLLFIRNRDVSAAIGKAGAAFEAHSNYKRRGQVTTEERFDFILHANGDASREMHVALLPFLV